MSVNNTGVNTVDYTPKPKLSDEEYHKQNENGLEQAYNSPSHLYKNNDTLYMAGTKNARDLYDDIKIPLGLTRYTQRYMDADKVLQQDPNIKNLIGHSLSGSVALEFQKNHPERNFHTTTYNAPVNSVTPSNDRYRDMFDSISAQDYGARVILKPIDATRSPHSYRDFSTGENLSGAVKSLIIFIFI
jgi:pimeloyl-ACP methyl ester carboxylesterase